jgi:hypothetical protein
MFYLGPMKTFNLNSLYEICVFESNKMLFSLVVIDYCMTKQLVKDDISNFTTLELTWASKSNCIQRSGRVGRVATGRVYRLLSKEHFRVSKCAKL